jgi:iron complex outermembrane receptor protein
MKSFAARFLCVAGTSLTAFMGDAALAQSNSAMDVETVIVTARRVEERLQDVPISMTVLSQEQIAARNIVSTVDLATYTPSLFVNRRFGNEKASFAIRGFTQDLTTAPTVAVYFADAITPRLVPNLGGGNGAGPGYMFDLQNTQVLYGPQGTLFGRNTNGGAVLLVPHRPTDKYEGYVEGTLGDYNQHRVQAVLNVPISEILKVRAGVDWNERDGYIKSLSGVGPKDFNNINYVAARLSILAEFTNWENSLIFTYTNSKTHGTLGKIAFCNPGTNPASIGFTGVTRAANCALLAREANYGYWQADNSDPNAHVYDRVWQAINTTTWHASDALTVKNILSYGEERQDSSGSVLGDFVPFPLVTASSGIHGDPQANQYTLTDELRFQGEANRLTWQGGLYIEVSNPIGVQEQETAVFATCTDRTTFMCTPLTLTIPGVGVVPVGSLGDYHHKYFYRDYAAYGQATYKVTDKFSITAGLRYTRDTTRTTGDDVSIVPSPTGPLSFRCTVTTTPAGANASLLTNGACLRAFEEKSGRPTWLIDFDFKPTQDILLYAKYARGYRAGGANYSNSGYETWSPEKVDDFEAGLKTTIRGDVISGTFNINGFWNNFKNQQVPISLAGCQRTDPRCTAPAVAGIQAIQNVGTSRIRGIEVDGALVFQRDFRLDYGYAFLDAKVIKSAFPGCNFAIFNCASADFLQAGQQLLFSPKHRLTLTGTYTLLSKDNVGDVTVGATYVYTASSFFSHSADLAFARGEIPFDSSVMPSSNLVNLNLNWRNIANKPIDLEVFVTNLTNEKYTVGAGNSLPTTGADFIFVGEPRMYGMKLRYHFGD